MEAILFHFIKLHQFVRLFDAKLQHVTVEHTCKTLKFKRDHYYNVGTYDREARAGNITATCVN